jgi:hypothetical protein
MGAPHGHACAVVTQRIERGIRPPASRSVDCAPFVDDALRGERSGEPRPARAAALATGAGETILMVDDNAAMLPVPRANSRALLERHDGGKRRRRHRREIAGAPKVVVLAVRCRCEEGDH